MSLMHLVRHGQASAGTDNYDRLSSIGQEQSRILGQWWLMQGFSPKAAFHGTLERQRDTATLSLKALEQNNQVPPMSEHVGLNEYDHRVVEAHFAAEHTDYEPEAMNFDEYLGVLSRWRDYLPDEANQQIEPWSEFKKRGWETLKELTQHADHEAEHDAEFVFFTSGGVIATVFSTVLNLDFEHTVNLIWRIRNTSITTFSLSNDTAQLVEFNSIAHLQEQRKSHLITLI